MSEIYVLLPDNGYDGLGEPVAAFRREDDAKRMTEILQKTSYRSYKVYAVHLMTIEEAAPA